MSGNAGLANALGGTAEYQGDGSPQFPGLLGACSVYEHNELHTIADLIKKKSLQAQDMVKVVSDYCNEEHVMPEKHIDHIDELEQA